MPEWISAHAQFDAPLYDVAFDDLIRRVYGPIRSRCVAEAWCDRPFFVRYGEGGPHLRIRVRALEGASAQVRDSIERAVARANGPRALRWVAYKPETERYGGAAALEVAEDYFTLSSDIALRMLDSGALAERSTRLASALSCMVVLLGRWFEDPSELAWLCRAYCAVGGSTLAGAGGAPPENTLLDSAYRSQRKRLHSAVQGILACVRRQADFEDAILMDWQAGVCRLHGRLRDLHGEGAIAGPSDRSWRYVGQQLLGSYLHMMNNRLGIRRDEEVYLAYIVARTVCDLTSGPRSSVGEMAGR